MDDRERRETGMRTRRAVLGDAHVDRAVGRTTPLTAEFQDLITRYAWGEIWTRPGLDLRTRRLIVIGTLVALGRFDELRMHVRAALIEGGSSAGRDQGGRAAAGYLLRRAGGQHRVRGDRRGGGRSGRQRAGALTVSRPSVSRFPLPASRGQGTVFPQLHPSSQRFP